MADEPKRLTDELEKRLNHPLDMGMVAQALALDTERVRAMHANGEFETPIRMVAGTPVVSISAVLAYGAAHSIRTQLLIALQEGVDALSGKPWTLNCKCGSITFGPLRE